MGQRNALCIGIDHYGGQNELSGCVNDANDWGDFFEGQGCRVQRLLDGRATFNGIVNSMGALVENASSGDVVAIHYSGHGTHVPDRNGDEPDGEDEALVPIDFGSNGFLVDDLIGPILDRARAGVAINVFFDCCHSGGGTRLLAESLSPRGATDEKVRFMLATPEMIEVHFQAQQRRAESAKRGTRTKSRAFTETVVNDAAMREVLFAACQPFELSLESGGNGHFTRAAMKVLGQGFASLTNTQFIQEVIAAMGSSRRQSPQLSCPSRLQNAPFLASLQGGGGNGDGPGGNGDSPVDHTPPPPNNPSFDDLLAQLAGIAREIQTQARMLKKNP